MKTNLKQAEFVPKRLTQARMAKMLNMTELAGRSGLTRQAVSQFEKGITNPSSKNLSTLSKELGVSERFLTRPLSEMETSIEAPLSFRSQASSTVRARNQASIYIEWLALLVDTFTQYVQLPDIDLPEFNVQDFNDLSHETIEQLAEQTRRHLGLGDGPISDITLLLENHGVVIGHVPLREKLDGLSTWFFGRPFMLIDSNATAVRGRFDLAHELAHLVLHKNLLNESELEKEEHKLIENQAHYFASCFLMPEKSFIPEVYGIDFDSLIRLKERWKVSIAAIIMRLSSVSLISEHQKRRLFQMLSARNARRHEPLDSEIPVEKPRLFKKIHELLNSEGILKKGDLPEVSSLRTDFIEMITSIPREFLEKDLTLDNVVLLRR